MARHITWHFRCFLFCIPAWWPSVFLAPSECTLTFRFPASLLLRTVVLTIASLQSNLIPPLLTFLQEFRVSSLQMHIWIGGRWD